MTAALPNRPDRPRRPAGTPWVRAVPEPGLAEQLACVRAVRELLAGIDGHGADATDPLRIDLLTATEELKGAITAAQARVTVAFGESQQAAGEAAGRGAREVDRGIGPQLALARRCSASTADRQRTLAAALTTVLPHTLAALTAGTIGEAHAQAMQTATTGLSAEVRMVIDSRLAGRLPILTPKQLGAAATHLAAELDVEALVAKHRLAVTTRGAWTRPAPDGMAYLTVLGPLPEIVGAVAALHAHATAVVAGHAQDDPAEDRTHAQVMADTALTRLSGRAVGQAQPVAVTLVMTPDNLYGHHTNPYDGAGSPAPHEAQRPLTMVDNGGRAARPKRAGASGSQQDTGTAPVGSRRPLSLVTHPLDDDGPPDSSTPAAEPPADTTSPRDPDRADPTSIDTDYGPGTAGEPDAPANPGTPVGSGTAAGPDAAARSGTVLAADTAARSGTVLGADTAADPDTTDADGIAGPNAATDPGTAADSGIAADSGTAVAAGTAVGPGTAKGDESDKSHRPGTRASCAPAATPVRIVGHGPIAAPLARAWLLAGCDAPDDDSGNLEPPDRPPPDHTDLPDSIPAAHTEPANRGGAPPPDEETGAHAPPAPAPAPALALAPHPAEVWLRRAFTSADGRDLIALESAARLFPPQLRSLLVLRDDVCRIPFCDAPIRHADHITPAVAGGPTTLSNGQGLSARCNYTKDLAGYTTRILSDAELAEFAAGSETNRNTIIARQAGPGTHVTAVTTPTGHTYLSSNPPTLGWAVNT